MNHCLPACFCGICVHCLTRHNLRTKAGVPPADAKGWVGDILCVLCCGACSLCQECRSVSADAWDITKADIKPMVKPFVFIRK